MIQEFDRRLQESDQLTDQRADMLESRAEEISDELPDDHRVHIEDFSERTGNPSRVVSELSPKEEEVDYVQQALAYVQMLSPALGVTDDAGQPAEFTPDPEYLTTSADAVTVHLQQSAHGIQIFQASQTVRFAPEGTIRDVVGQGVTVPADIVEEPTVSVTDAVRHAVEHLSRWPDESDDLDEDPLVDQFGQSLQPVEIDLEAFDPRIVAAFLEIPQRPHVLEASVLQEPIKASLIWFPLGDDLRLGWLINLMMPPYAGQFKTIVDATDGSILYSSEVSHQVRATGDVHPVDGATPCERVDLPVEKERHPVDPDLIKALPEDFPTDWVEEAETRGNNAICRIETEQGLSTSVGRTLEGSIEDGVATFKTDPDSEEQRLLNAFYFVNQMHNYFYQLGFRENEGNFQHDNFERGGLGVDRVDIRCLDKPINGTATMFTLRDGVHPVMRLGLVGDTSRHTAIDSSVVYHEYAHGVTNRVVGGPRDDMALTDPQPRSMGEGWSDYFACTYNGTQTVGSWVVDDETGIRQAPYDENFPDRFGDIGTGHLAVRQSGRRQVVPVHSIGAIWAATLLQMNRNLDAEFDGSGADARSNNRPVGTRLGTQLVFDALKLVSRNPSMLDVRDAILQALDDLEQAEKRTANERQRARRAIWHAFAAFEMGPNADSHGPLLAGIVSDTSLPADL